MSYDVSSDAPQGTPRRALFFVTGVDQKYFASCGILLESLKEHFPGIPLYIMDFGLSAPQRKLLADLDILLERPAGLKASDHPYKLKSATGQFIGDVPGTPVWIDADIMALRNEEAAFRDLVDTLADSGRDFAWTPDQGPNPTIGQFRRHYECPLLVAEAGADIATLDDKPYGNAGLIAFLNRDILPEWQRLSARIENEMCWEQNALNLIAHRSSGKSEFLDARRWNTHSSLLDQLSMNDQVLYCGEQPVVFAHATSAMPTHIGLYQLPTVMSGLSLPQQIKIFTNPVLQQAQTACLVRFLEHHAEYFDASRMAAGEAPAPAAAAPEGAAAKPAAIAPQGPRARPASRWKSLFKR